MDWCAPITYRLTLLDLMLINAAGDTDDLMGALYPSTRTALPPNGLCLSDNSVTHHHTLPTTENLLEEHTAGLLGPP